ncbi:MAG: MerR family transcriptional regulator [Chloroflexota bacterium]|jgi:methylmalonyl-CoA mutase cobalamin-binding subunit
MYTIKQAALRTGIPVALLRQWERRYDVVHPARTPSGYRAYDDAAIDRFRAMRALVDDGWAPSAAAARVRGLDDADIRGLARPQPVARPIEGPPGPALTDAFLRAAGDLDQSALEDVLDEMFGRGSFELVAEQSLLPTLRALGAAWAGGRVDVAAEHAASLAVMRRLASAFQAAGRPSAGHPLVLVGLPPGARHELGAFVFAVAARRAGLGVLYLGADLPVRDWVEAMAQTGARAAVVGVVSDADVPAAERVADGIAEQYPARVVAFGGGAAASVPGGPARMALPTGLTQSVDALRAAVDGYPPDRPR